MPDREQPSIIVDAWLVPDGDQREFVAAMVGMFERLRGLEGFVQGEILEGVDPTRFVTYARMSSARAREAAMLDPEVQATMRRVGGIARPNPAAYRIAYRFAPSGPAGSAD